MSLMIRKGYGPTRAWGDGVESRVQAETVRAHKRLPGRPGITSSRLAGQGAGQNHCPDHNVPIARDVNRKALAVYFCV